MSFAESRTTRGFGIVKFTDACGVECSVQESSAVDPHLWIGPNKANPMVMALAPPLAMPLVPPSHVYTDETTGWVPYPVPDGVLMTTRAHMNREQVQQLVEVLQRWLDTSSVLDTIKPSGRDVSGY